MRIRVSETVGSSFCKAGEQSPLMGSREQVDQILRSPLRVIALSDLETERAAGMFQPSAEAGWLLAAPTQRSAEFQTPTARIFNIGSVNHRIRYSAAQSVRRAFGRPP